jgi:hydrogenase expression/formation protein HypC
MCLGIPGKVVHWLDRDPTFARAEVEFDGIRRVCHMACVTEASEGDYVIVHAGVAISRIDHDQAQRIFAELVRFNDDEGWRMDAGVSSSSEARP